MRLTAPSRVTAADTTRLQVTLETALGEQVLWYDFDSRVADAFTDTRLDGFAVAATMIAMERGERELIVDGVLSERLFHNLVHQIVPIMRLVVPEWHPVEIRPAALEPARPSAGAGVVTGFSGGIDSFCTIADYRETTLPGYRLTHLFFCNVGANGRGAGGERLFEQRWALVRDVATELGLGLVRVNSNLDALLETRFERTHVLRNASVILLLQGLFAKYLYSSTYRFEDCYIGEASDLAYADPAFVHLLSTETLESLSTGCQYSRVEKTRRAVQVPQAAERLNVCVDPMPATGRNCSACFKCLRTLVTLELLGELERFSGVFDLNIYRRWRLREQYLMMLPARQKDPFIREILELARERPEALPRHVALFHHAWPLLRLPYAAARAVRKALPKSG
jgi:hypothetical protein